MKLLIAVIGVLFGSGCTIMTQQHDSYNDYNFPRDCQLNERRPSLLDPQNFYWCLEDGPVLMKCVTGTFFNVTVGRCTEEIKDIPRDDVVVSVDDETVKNTRCLQPRSTPQGVNCPPNDPETHSIYHADPKDCECFYQCDNGKAKRIPCWEGLHFNATTNLCDWPEEAGCQAPNGYKNTENLNLISES